jgi:transcriptional regulator with XRE-family HTH domain
MTGKDAARVRRRLGLTQAKFWSRVRVTQGGGSRYESGGRRIPRPVQVLLAIAYGTAKQRDAALKKLGAEVTMHWTCG